ncbi:hypothetical protein CPB85DRAFT_1290809 [Mucidula mucida]|nr:hypothetical protein CPB85DRAFT_1290809 [Mucidula mucida]
MSGNGREFEYEDLQFAVGETASQVKVYFKDCEPPGTLGSPGDVYLATIQKKLRLYGRVSDGWKVWAGPSKKDDWYLVFHPHAPDHVLWSNIHRYGWFNTSVAKGSGSSGQSSHDILQAAQKRRVSTAKKREKEDPSNPPPKRQKMTLALEPSMPSTSFCPPPSTSISAPPLSMPSTFVPPPSTPPLHHILPLPHSGARRRPTDRVSTCAICARHSSLPPPNAGKAELFSTRLSSHLRVHSQPLQREGQGRQARAHRAGVHVASSAGASATNVIDLTGIDDDDDDDIQHIPVPASTSVKPMWMMIHYGNWTTPHLLLLPKTMTIPLLRSCGGIGRRPPYIRVPEYSKSPSPVYPTAPALEGLSESQRDAFMSIYDSVTHEKIEFAYFEHEHIYMCKVCVILHGQENGELVIDANDTFIRDNHVVDVHKPLLLHLLDHWDFRVRYETFTVQDLNYKLSCHFPNFSPS